MSTSCEKVDCAEPVSIPGGDVPDSVIHTYLRTRAKIRSSRHVLNAGALAMLFPAYSMFDVEGLALTGGLLTAPILALTLGTRGLCPRGKNMLALGTLVSIFFGEYLSGSETWLQHSAGIGAASYLMTSLFYSYGANVGKADALNPLNMYGTWGLKCNEEDN